MEDHWIEILLNLDINDLKLIYVTNITFYKILTSTYFWKLYFLKYGFEIPDKKMNIKQWIILFNATSIVTNMEKNKRSQLPVFRYAKITFNQEIVNYIKNRNYKKIEHQLIYNKGFFIEIIIEFKDNTEDADSFDISKAQAIEYVEQLFDNNLL